MYSHRRKTVNPLGTAPSPVKGEAMRNGVKKQFWLTEEEAQDLKHKAEITGLTEVAVIRMLLKGYHPKEKPDRYFYDALRQLYYFGNNLDRLLKKANSLGFIDAPLLRQEIKAWQTFRSDIERKYLEPEKSNIKWK